MRRHVATVFVVLMSFIAYMDRENLAIVATTIEKLFHLNLVEIGAISSIFFLSYAAMQIPGGILAERVGPRKTMTAAMTWWSAFTMLTTLGFNYISFLLIRFLFGFGEGPLFPSATNLYSRWLKKGEITLATSLEFVGIALGALVGVVAATVILLSLGWQWVFIIFGIIGLLITLGYYVVMRDMPEEARWVGEKEVESVKSSYNNPEERARNLKQNAPWGRLLRSGRFWAYGWTHGTFDSLLYMNLTLLPLYLEEVRGFSKSSIGLVGTLPWVLFIVGLLIFGPLMDRAIVRGASLQRTYAIPSGVGLLVSGAFVLLGAVAVSPALAVAFLSLAMFFATIHQASWSIANRMGGKYSGSYSAWFNLWGNALGGSMPLIITFVASAVSWVAALTILAVVVFSGGAAWFFVKPDRSFVPELIPSYTPPKPAAQVGGPKAS
ncbi:MFS transporter [Sulfodiicoccus acidiphilus]|uniref:MFS transporter n=1 Tax=Sulfodiicoccus acidiphilus TaxID=1670455 RepID=A0A348B5H1_9CREN|nr:MFS transporter [Sulfodiicoccus acidiphilus]BBD73423.1 MFS transporter [Sulfodiicoccus acidiphilus]GGT98642.1 MFS transporter [Sulfodiicoccus acidiphilus]